MKLLPLLLTALLASSSLCAQNYDESKVGTYTLPDVLKLESGKSVTSKKVWEQQRRSEILGLFEEHVYGQFPTSYDKLEYSVKREDPKAMNGKAHLKEMELVVYKNNKPVKINLVLFVPTAAKGPAPAFLLINNRSRRNTAPERDTLSGFWPAEMVINAGYAVAAFHNSELAPDNKNSYQNGVLQLYPEQLNADNGMKAIGAWAWGASRVLDYFEKDPTIDAKRVAVVGHSRGGKASLWAAAQDQRFAICVSNCSGNTGAALSRRNFGETVTRINTTFPHWFSTNYKKYNDKEDELPVDQHMLIALIAPRPIYVTNASKDLWADPTGTFLAMKEAERVYNLFGLKSALPQSPPPINTPVVHPPMGYHNREGSHDLTEYDWARFIELANYHYKKK
ncbi:dienelactone hydrolase family protein [Telluribacter sp. SYSU D00476]|uniref:dienelactone hydrolase family protein n=1 Tax=Telluribacter sp. SYSU D00476 TaxID=2811430 RepID=UPI001FF30418|nr:prolyl oligopeptidase family serine peptidase [Telluribacter sp. SYSU D00476]